MILEKIDEKRLLIALSDDDMNILDLSFKQLSWQNEYSRQVITKILNRAQSEIGFFINNNKLLIEALPQKSGCFVLVTLLSGNEKGRKVYRIKEEIKPYLFVFKSPEDLLCAIERVYNKDNMLTKSTLFEYNKNYYVLIYLKGCFFKDLQTIFTEYGQFANKKSVSISRLIEIGNLIVKDNAIEIIGRHLAG